MPASPDLAFETPLVRARLLCEDDLDLYLALYTDPEVMRHIGPLLGREEATSQFRKAIVLTVEDPARVRYWAAYRTEDACEAPLGLLSAARNGSRTRTIEIGIMLLGREQRRGYGSALLSWLIRYVFTSDVVDVDVVIAKHLWSNVAAGKLFAGLGFSAATDEDYAVRECALTLQQWLQRTRSLPLASMST